MLYGKIKQQEFEDRGEREYQEHESEEFLRSQIKGSGGVLGGMGEGENANELESEVFYTKIHSFARQLAPMLKKIAPIAARDVGIAIAGKLAREYEFESEYKFDNEVESEYEYEAAPQPEALAETLAIMASHVQNGGEAEAYTGALTARIIPIKSYSMWQIAPKLVKGAATLTRTFRQSPATRPLVKTVPTIVARTSNILAQQAAQGKAIAPQTAALVMAAGTYKVLGNPMICAKTLMRSSGAVSKVTKPSPAKVVD